MSREEVRWTARCPRCGLVVSGETAGGSPPYPVTTYCFDCHEWFEIGGSPAGRHNERRVIGEPYRLPEESAELDGGFR